MTYRVNGQILSQEEWVARPGKMDWSNLKSPMIDSVKPFVSPIDGSVISTRAGLRAHEIEHSVIQVGDAFEKIVKTKKEDARERKFESDRDTERDRRNFNWH
ncbi:MAG: hypothetical protein V3V81_07425 [Candidatus Bathyarchaeia archaeon]